MKIRNIYNKEHFSVELGTSIKEALRMLVKDEVNGLLIINSDKQLVGVLSLQDIAAAIIPFEMKEHLNLASSMYKTSFFSEQCDKIKHKKVEEIMRTNLIKVSPESNIMEIVADFLKNDLYIVPVYENEQLVGVITRTEIKKALADAMNT